MSDCWANPNTLLCYCFIGSCFDLLTCSTLFVNGHTNQCSGQYMASFAFARLSSGTKSPFTIADEKVKETVNNILSRGTYILPLT